MTELEMTLKRFCPPIDQRVRASLRRRAAFGIIWQQKTKPDRIGSDGIGSNRRGDGGRGEGERERRRGTIVSIAGGS